MTDRIAVIGQGYVGLPLALAFAKIFPVTGYDVNEKRVASLQGFHDVTKEVNAATLAEAFEEGYRTNAERGYRVTSDLEAIALANIFIITVPTPIDAFNAPDLQFLKSASAAVGKILKKGDLVIYESTVYPGCTEEDCVPILEVESGLSFNCDFFVGYSPERINPGDKVRTLENTVKVTSGSTPETANRVDALYKTIIAAGTHKASSIKVAEAAKAIENAQRDVNISFVNELALIFDRVGIDTNEVLEAASTKYNFLRFKPGLVGGHCISVDPYYLAHKSSQLGYHPEVILSGRRVNDRMAEFIAGKTVKLLVKKGITIKGAKALILGITFKENCPDIRNSKVVDVYHELKEFGLNVDIYDPWADPLEVEKEYAIKLLKNIPLTTTSSNRQEVFAKRGKKQCAIDSALYNDIVDSRIAERSIRDKSDKTYDAVILAVAHEEFLGAHFGIFQEEISVVFDTKGVLPRDLVDARL